MKDQYEARKRAVELQNNRCGIQFLCFLAVCPAGWKPGKSTMKPTVKESKDYFSKEH